MDFKKIYYTILKKELKEYNHKMITILMINSSKKWCGVDQVLIDSLNIPNTKNFKIIPIVKSKSDIYFKLKKKNLLFYSFPFKQPIDFYTLFKLINLIKKIKQPILHIHTAKDYPYGFFFKIFFPKIKLIFSRHNSFKLNYSIRFFSNFFVDQWIAVSKFIKAEMIKQKIVSKKIIVIYNALSKEDPSSYQKQVNAFNRNPLILKNSFKIGYLGRIHPEKGIESFIKTATLFKNSSKKIQFLIAGKADISSYDKKIKNMISAFSKETIYYLDFIEEKFAYLQLLDILVIPSSQKWEEPFCLTALEALSKKTAIIATAYGALKELLSHQENAFLIKNNHPSSIIKAIKTLMNNKTLMKKIKEKGPTTIGKRFTLEKMTKKLKEAYSNQQIT